MNFNDWYNKIMLKKELALTLFGLIMDITLLLTGAIAMLHGYEPVGYTLLGAALATSTAMIIFRIVSKITSHS